MGFTGSYLVKLLLYIAIVNAIFLRTAVCQSDESNSQCIPKKVFLALLRLPEASSNLAAYSRTARIIQDAKNRNDMAHLKALSTEENDDSEICIPGSLYLELFRDPTMRAHLTTIGKSSKLPEYPFGRSFEEMEEGDSRESLPEAEKRSLATLAKNGDLPVSIQDRKEENSDDDEEKRSIAVRYRVSNDADLEALLKILRGLSEEDSSRNIPDILHEYILPNGELDLDALIRDHPYGKRNVGALARDFALPPSAGRRNIASLARDHALPSGKRNLASLARTYTLPHSGKRNVAALARSYMLPQSGKRDYLPDEIAPIERRYIASLARSGGFPYGTYDEGKRSIASLARNGDWPDMSKRAYGFPPYGSMILRTMNRQGRSLKEKPLDLQQLTRERHDDGRSSSFDDDRLDFLMRDSNDRRTKRQIDFSDEYPLPVMQNANVLDYEEMIEALTGQYPNTEKRFMGAESSLEIPAEASIPVGYLETFQPSKRHIGSLARQGSLPSIRAARFSRSPRYQVERTLVEAALLSNDHPVEMESQTRYSAEVINRNYFAFLQGIPLDTIDAKGEFRRWAHVQLLRLLDDSVVKARLWFWISQNTLPAVFARRLSPWLPKIPFYYRRTIIPFIAESVNSLDSLR